MAPSNTNTRLRLQRGLASLDIKQTLWSAGKKSLISTIVGTIDMVMPFNNFFGLNSKALGIRHQSTPPPPLKKNLVVYYYGMR